MLDGLMMDFPLTLTHFFERAARFYPHREIVTRGCDRKISRYTIADMARRSRLLMTLLSKLGVQPGQRVATLAWNSSRHLEAYFGVPLMGAVVHTLNPRLHPDELAFMANQAEDVVVLVDYSLLSVLAKFRDRVKSLKHVVVFGDEPSQAGSDMDYETELASCEPVEALPRLEENSAAMLCYTSGTTGNPKGVLFSHRSTVLHALCIGLRDTLGVANDDTLLAVVPMFHAAAWGMCYAAMAVGARLILPGPHLDPVSVLELMEGERVTFAAGVPTVWLGILDFIDRNPGKYDLSAVRTTAVGGSAAPPSMIAGFQERHGIEVTHAWGMTEMSPVGTICTLRPEHFELSAEEQLKIRASQGVPSLLVEQRHTDDSGKVLPWDGKTVGELEVRGPWVARAYYGGDGADRFTADGWFKTGDVVTINEEGYVQINDRSKDVVKSGGEWICSVGLENALMGHPSVLEAAVFAAQHPTWTERPVAAIVLREGKSASKEELTGHLAPNFAKYWLPDEYLFVEEIPRTSTGKFYKARLRELYGMILVPEG